tara:strand:- start:903 stop:1874 length:972 start_codon:yes stop_codon:yes gene_type:complete
MTSKRVIIYPDGDPDENPALAQAGIDRLSAYGTLRVHHGSPESNEDYLSRITDANALIVGWSLPADVMANAPQLELITFTGTGAHDYIDLPAAQAQGITVCNCPGYADTAVAEHAFALLLGTARNLAQLDRKMRESVWDQDTPGIGLAGKQLGLIGFGGIAKKVRTMAQAFGMQVKVWTRSPEKHRNDCSPDLFFDMETLLETSDFISLHLPLNDKTHGILGSTEIRKIKTGATLINTARGGLIDESALIEALRNGHLRGAGLDVFAEEPLNDNHHLLGLENVVLSPHVAYNTPEAVKALFEITIENICSYFDGKPINVVAAP